MPEELDDRIHWEHSQNVSAQRGLNNDDHVEKLRVNVGADHNLLQWSKK